VLLGGAVHLPRAPLIRASPGWAFGGAAFLVFGGLYPHFLTTDTWTAYAYASPFGLLPCPTLSVVIGFTLAVGGFHSAPWNVALAAAGIVYGAIGVFGLGVALDVWLLGGGVLLGALVGADAIGGRVRATKAERMTRRLPGDELIPVAAAMAHSGNVRRRIAAALSNECRVAQPDPTWRGLRDASGRAVSKTRRPLRALMPSLFRAPGEDHLQHLNQWHPRPIE
jgi:hypothetical protein